MKKNKQKGVALIVVIFAMMLFACLGWTLAVMQATDFEANLRNFDSEGALGLAETGMQWSLNQLFMNPSWRTGNGDSDCNDNGDWLTHTLSPGQYRVCCRNPTASETGNAIIESRGYIPLAPPPSSNYRAMRQLKMSVTLGSFSKVLQAYNLFDWTSLHGGSRLNGDIQAGNYERNGNGTYNEAGIDYAEGGSPLPRDGTGDDRDVASTPYPTITMSDYEGWAGSKVWAPPHTSKIKTGGISVVDGRTRLDLEDNIFTGVLDDWDDEALRNISLGTWQTGSWIEIYNVLDSDTVDLDGLVTWQEGQRVSVVPKVYSRNITGLPDNYYSITLSCNFFTNPLSQWENEGIRNVSSSTQADWEYKDWGVIEDVPAANQAVVRIDTSVDLTNPAYQWQVGDMLCVTKRYRRDVSSDNLWYIRADTLFDLRNRQTQWEAGGIDGDIAFRNTALVAEGDIAIKGINELGFNERPFTYPNLATQGGNIISKDTPGGSSEGARRRRRDFADLIYTQTGTVNFNYLMAQAVYGYNVFLDGQVRLDYNDLSGLAGFTWGLSNAKWEEN